jgi:hypothetical protein
LKSEGQASQGLNRCTELSAEDGKKDFIEKSKGDWRVPVLLAAG